MMLLNVSQSSDLSTGLIHILLLSASMTFIRDPMLD